MRTGFFFVARWVGGISVSFSSPIFSFRNPLNCEVDWRTCAALLVNRTHAGLDAIARTIERSCSDGQGT